jgi:hypothetical protein
MLPGAGRGGLVNPTWEAALDAYERLIIGLENGHIPPSIDAAFAPLTEPPSLVIIERFQALQDRAVRCEQKVRANMDEIQQELRTLGQRRQAARSYTDH